MSTIQAIAFRRLQLAEVSGTFVELSRPGVYLLLGFDEAQPNHPVAYIGESENVTARLKRHAYNDIKEFWIETIALVSKDENLTKSHARYVEARLIAEAASNPRWKLMNSQQASEVGKLPLPDRAAMEEFIDQTKTLVGALSCDLFKVVAGNLVGLSDIADAGVASRPDLLFHCSGANYDARMAVTVGGEFVVRSGSLARKLTTAAAPEGIVSLRSDLIAKGILVERSDRLEFMADYVFSSVSGAAAAVTGTSVNGRLAWKLHDGRTYADWEKQQNDQLPSGMTENY